jgi:GT2 family glycosyltransferase
MADIDLSIIIVNYKTPELVRDCVKSIKKHTTGIKYEVIVMDNSINNIGFTKANNLGLKKAKGEYVLFLNSDTYIDSNVLSGMVKWMETNPKIGISTCKLKNRDGSPQTTGGYFPTLPRVLMWMTIQDLPFMDNLFSQFHPHKNKNKAYELDWVTGAFLLIRREVLNEIKGFSEDYFMYGDDVDLCFRAKKLGFEVWFNPEFSITHYGGASSVKEFPLLSEYKGVKIFYKKYYPKWQYPIMRLLLKIGAALRIPFFGSTYVKAFKEA